MKLPKGMVDQIMRLSMYQAFYEKVAQLLQTEGTTLDDIAEVAATLENAIDSGSYKNLPEYKNAINKKL